MDKRRALTLFLAAAGTLLAWLPLLAPFVLGAIAFVAHGVFRFDYLMPAELFPVAFIGAALLLWAAIRARARIRQVAWGMGISAASLAGGQGLAVVTGLASGAIDAAGWPLLAVLASLAIYALALLSVASAGILLLRDLLGRPA